MYSSLTQMFCPRFAHCAVMQVEELHFYLNVECLWLHDTRTHTVYTWCHILLKSVYTEKVSILLKYLSEKCRIVFSVLGSIRKGYNLFQVFFHCHVSPLRSSLLTFCVVTRARIERKLSRLRHRNKSLIEGPTLPCSIHKINIYF